MPEVKLIVGTAEVPATVKVEDVTEVTVPTLIVPPRLVEVPLMVIALFVRDALAILDKVLVAPLIDLFVKTWDPVSVATVESMAIVTGEEPLNEVPDSPVPIVKVLVVLAVTVVEPPKDTELPFIVIALLANCALLIVPLKAVVGMVVDDVIALAPLPYI
jgi:hypothetical protein